MKKTLAFLCDTKAGRVLMLTIAGSIVVVASEVRSLSNSSKQAAQPTPVAEVVQSPKQASACQVKFKELLAIEDTGSSYSDYLTYNRDQYAEAQLQARQKMSEMEALGCTENPGRVRF